MSTSEASQAAKARSGGKAALRHFLDLDQLPAETLNSILALAHAYKRGDVTGPGPGTDRTLAMMFEKPSTRTRVSFEVGMGQMGGRVTVLDATKSQLGRGESVADTARVLSRYADVIMFRTLSEASLKEMVAHATVPVINGLTDKSHPCQIMADIMTFEEVKGPIKGRTIAWVGDGNNVCTSWIHAAARFGFTLQIGTPAAAVPNVELVHRAGADGADIFLTDDPMEAVNGADCVVTDTWLSMGNGAESGEQREAWIKTFKSYRVDEALMAAAAPGAVFMHCLPASREREVAAAVIDGPQSVVWDEAENRLHAQKAILHWCLGGIKA